jgi:anaerobic dimethyl sulfoxide reductase subunit B (iron-sulfur subunit)
MPQYGWLFDAKRCIECRACEAACKQWNGLDTGVQFRKVRVKEMGRWPNVRTQAISFACNHCDNPLCLRACPVKAMYRREEDGAVIIDQNKCVGCRLCEKFCPYGAPAFNEKTGKMMKCTMCYDRLEMGLQPACATVCPTGALQFKPWDEIAGTGADVIENFNPPETTRPRIRFITTGWPGQGR